MKSRISFLSGLSLPLIRSAIILSVLFAMTVFLLSLRHAHAAATTFTVNSLDDTDDDGNCDSAPDCTLREAINAANSNPGADTIDFSVTGTINLTGPLPDITDDLMLNGPGATLLTVRRDSDSGDYRIFTVTTLGVVTFSEVTISNGASLNLGGGIENGSAGTVNVISCTLDSNSAENGGGGIHNNGTAKIKNSSFNNNSSASVGGAAILNFGSMTVVSSTISDNNSATGGGAGGGIYNAGTLEVSQSTLTNNNAAGLGGGIYNSGSQLSVTNSTLSGNFAGIGGAIFNEGTATITSSTLSNNGAGQAGGIGSVGPFYLDSSIVALNNAQGPPHDISGVVTSRGYNAVGSVDNKSFNVAVTDQVGVTAAQLKLGPLQDNGGPTQTIELCRDSVAIDKGDDRVLDPPLRLTTDQRGLIRFRRRIGSHVDVGAYEVVSGLARLCS